MSTFRIPNEQGQIRQINKGDVFGELWGTFNIDLSNTAKIRTSKRLSKVLSSSFLGDASIMGITVHDGKYYVATTENVYDCSVSNDPTVNTNWTATGTLGSEDLGLETDMTSYAGKLLISLGTDIMTWDGATKDDDWWTVTTSGTALTVNKPHILHVQRTGVDTVFVTDGNLVRYYNATAGHTAITLEPLFTACAITSGVDSVWIGTYTEVEENAFVYEMTVGNTAASQAYRIDGRAVLSMDMINNIPYIVTDRGHIQAFNGSGFVTVASFPFAFKDVSIEGIRAGLIQDSSRSRAIHPKGMRASSDSLFVLVNTANEYTTFNNTVVDERSPSGIWEFDTTTEVLNHRYSLADATGEHGHHKMSLSSPIFVTNSQYTKILTGGQTDTGTNGLFAEDSTNNPQGFFITPELTSGTIQEAYEKIVIKANTLADDESITIKYRTSKKQGYPHEASITWLSATKFVTTDTVFAAAEVGEEIEILTGAYAGNLCHVVEVTGTSSYTVTIDEELGTLNATSRARLQNWKKLDRQYLTTDAETFTSSVTQTGGWVQFKVVMNGFIELRQFISKGNAKTEM